ncbi:hypothetical protein Fcan01_10518 [Folsomia candida]|uniref:Uncharacterized protein n=1 Tax=Folsomia candida TaxID=158441 RepID=A0A226EA96_FOLCA|nr:hypothetical protein Fcan01_10518 [Folsomia candida]
MIYIVPLFLCVSIPNVVSVSIGEYFLNIDNPGTLHFIFASDDTPKKIDFDQASKHYVTMIAKNNRSPLLIQRILNHTEIINDTEIFHPKRSNRGLFSHIQYTILQVDWTNTRFSHVEKILLDHVSSNFNPKYIFLISNYPISLNYYGYYVILRGSSTLIILNETMTDVQLFIPCIICPDLPPNEKNMNELTVTQIKHIWKSRNTNMQRKPVAFATSYPVRQMKKCGPNLPTSDFYRECTISVLAELYNFTLITPQFHRHQLSKNKFVGSIGFSHYLDKDFISGFQIQKPLIYKTTFSPVTFLIVTDHPTLMNNFAVFLHPFDASTWTLIFTSAIAITIVVRLAGYRNSLFSDFLRIASLLLGQVGGNMLQLFKSRGIASHLVLTLWFWACYILMFNLYQGSIFSYLSVTVPPRVPRTMGELLDSEFKVVTRSSLELWNAENKTVTDWSLLLQEVLTFKEVLWRNESIEKYDRLEKRIKFCRVNEIDSLTLARSLSFSVQEYAGFRQEPIVLMDVDFAISDLAVLLEALGGRYVIKGRDTTPFDQIAMSVGQRNFLAPYISETIDNLEEFGISGRWEEQRLLQHKLKAMVKLGGANYSGLLRKEMADGSEPFVFHEAAPVSLKVMKFVFFLCSGFVLLAGGVFGWECRKD